MEELNKKFTLTPQQIKAEEYSRKYKLMILTGKPGTGKTSAVKNIIEQAVSRGLVIVQCAPTGKAAKRMVEATGYPASTVHSTLGSMFDKGKFVFAHNEINPLSCDLLVIDEWSMADNWLVACLLRAVDVQRTHVVVVGDTGQLASVGPGAVLHDMLASKKIPHVELDTIFRNSGAIVEACSEVHDGFVYEPYTKLDLDAENPINLIHVASPSQERTAAGIIKLVAERMPLRGFDPVWDIQVLSPTNTKTELSCEALNKKLQDKLNPGKSENGFLFREGDKVINTKNERVKGTDNRETVIVNGDMGSVVEINKKHIIVKFFDPDREVLLSRAGNNLLLAYAITTHRFQGSEQQVIIIPIDNAFSYFCDRRWIYTSLSRGKQIVITVGKFQAMEKMIYNSKKLNRRTRLAEKIIAEFEKDTSVLKVYQDIDDIGEDEEFFDI